MGCYLHSRRYACRGEKWAAKEKNKIDACGKDVMSLHFVTPRAGADGVDLRRIGEGSGVDSRYACCGVFVGGLLPLRRRRHQDMWKGPQMHSPLVLETSRGLAWVFMRVGRVCSICSEHHIRNPMVRQLGQIRAGTTR